jgi:hypothetical protein
MKRLPALYWAAGCWTAILGIVIVLSLAADIQWEIPPDFSRSDQCEALHIESMIMEPQNTWSNFGYLLAGLLVLFRGRGVFAKFFGAILCALFLFSGMYHAAPVEGSLQFLDVLSIYWVLMAAIAYASLAVLKRYGVTVTYVGRGAIVIGVILLAGIAMTATRTKIIIFDSTYAVFIMGFILLVFLIIGFVRAPAFLSQGQQAFYVLGVALAVGLSGVFRLLDGPGNPLCYPDGMLGILQSHAVWHVLSAALLFLTWDYFSSVSGDGGSFFAPNES